MNFDYYLFDLDGTLLNLGNMGAYADQILEETLKKLEILEIPSENERRTFWFSIENYVDVLKKWGAKNPKDFWKYYDEIDFEKRRVRISKHEICLFDDVIETLEKIYFHSGNKKLAIVTNTVSDIVHYILNTFNIHMFFHEIFSLGFENDQDSAKPSPEGIFTILKKFDYNSKHDKAIMVGDSAFDIMAAKKAKISACLIKRHFNRNFKEWKVQPDHVIEQLDELVDL